MEHHFNIYVAKDYGIEEAILLHNFYFWLSKNAANEKHFHDGLYWFYNSKKAFVDLFPYMNETKIFRSIKKLEGKGIVVKGNFNEDKWVRTNWYAITQKGLLYLHSKGYSISDFSASLQNDTFDSGKMNDGALQNEQSILINNNTDTNTNNIQEKEDIIISSKKKAKKGIDISIVSPEMREPVETWLAYKKEKCQSYKPTGFKTFYKKLCELSGNNPQVAMAIIEQSMSNNYAGIFPLKNNNYNYGRETVTDRIKRTLANAEEFKKRIDASIGKQAEMDFGDEKDVW